jgi:membrane-bound lytic murein transglycosylase B
MRILKEGHIEPEELKGSWAGAMGQCQFMPTSFIAYAADGDGDGKKDIWTNEADVFASAASYLKKHGWKRDQAWGQRVVLSKILPAFKISERGLSGRKTVAEWKKLGIIAKKGGLKVADTEKARLYIPNGPSKEAWLVYNNFDTVLDWNRSSFFAFSANALADAIGQKEGAL